jgi:hypothetical protein
MLGVVLDQCEVRCLDGSVVEGLEQAVALDGAEGPLHRGRADGALRLELVDVALHELLNIGLVRRGHPGITGLGWHHPPLLWAILSTAWLLRSGAQSITDTLRGPRPTT